MDDDDYSPFDIETKKRIAPFKVDETLDDIARITKIAPNELKTLYRTFKQECPKGYLDLERFIEVFTTIYPFAKADEYATLIFRTMEKDMGAEEVSFKSLLVWLTRLRNGTFEEKVRWIFRLYDVNGDGHVTREEIKHVIIAVHQLMDATAADDMEMDVRAQAFFRRFGYNDTYSLTLHDFMEMCEKDADIKSGLESLNYSLDGDGL